MHFIRSFICIFGFFEIIWLVVLVSGETCYDFAGNARKDTPCGFDTTYCCPGQNTCMTQGICRDVNNHPDGSLTYFQGSTSPGPYNWTGLYSTSTCTNADWPSPDCPIRCTATDSYVWACNDELTLFCCQGTIAGGQGDCCQDTTWTLPSPPVALNTTLSASSSHSTASSDPLSTNVAVTSSTASVVTVTVPTGVTASSMGSTAITSAPTSTASKKEADMSTGAEAGIGAGVGGCVVGAAILGMWLWFRKSRRNRKNMTGISEPSANDLRHMEVHYTQELPEQKPQEMPLRNQNRHELPS